MNLLNKTVFERILFWNLDTYLHFLKDSGTIIGDDDFTVGAILHEY